MTYMHYYKRNIGDYAKKAGRLSMLQHGAYTLLIDACYDRESFPTLDQAIEWTWASTSEEIEAVKFVLHRFFTLEAEFYVQNRIQQEISDYHGKSKTNKRIAIERETNRKEKRTKRAPFVNEAPPNQEPLTTNQEPLTIKPKDKGSVSGPLTVVGAPPEKFDKVEPVSRSIEIAVYLRQRGISGANSANPNICVWADDVRVTNEMLDAALSVVASRHLDKQPGPGYLVGIIADLVNPKPAVKPKADDWTRSKEGIERKGREMGIFGRGTESHDSLKNRIIEEISRLMAKGATA